MTRGVTGAAWHDISTDRFLNDEPTGHGDAPDAGHRDNRRVALPLSPGVTPDSGTHVTSPTHCAQDLENSADWHMRLMDEQRPRRTVSRGRADRKDAPP